MKPPSRREAAMQKIEQSIEKVNDAVNEMARVVLNLETWLYERGAPPASVVVCQDVKLSWERSGEKFRIVVDASGKKRPWAECTRSEKLSAYDGLDSLIEAIAAESEKLAEDVS